MNYKKYYIDIGEGVSTVDRGEGTSYKIEGVVIIICVLLEVEQRCKNRES